MTEHLESHFASILQAIGENPQREVLMDTPARAARAMEFLTKGYREDIHTIVKDAIFQAPSDEMIIVQDIEMYSLCEHHLLPFIGKCHIAYIPNGKILGLSKVARIAEMFSRRLQIQEQLTVQIANSISQLINPAGVGVVIQAKHLCMMMRGVEKQNSVMTTSAMLGVFRDSATTRNEFLSLVR
jgi:GTP cyclohydrolase IA